MLSLCELVCVNVGFFPAYIFMAYQKVHCFSFVKISTAVCGREKGTWE